MSSSGVSKSKDRSIPDLKPRRILLCNDDGINAPGLKVLEKVARQLADEVWVVAPETEQSGASHALTLTLPLRVRQISRRRFAVSGTPTDCVLMALSGIMKDNPPDLVLSGINRGGNLGEDVVYSGTVAAAMEATLIGVPAIALSQSFARREKLRWKTAERHAPDLIRKLCAIGWPEDVLINVNFPDIDADEVVGVDVCRQGKRDLSALDLDERVDARGQTYYWIGFRPVNGRPARATDLAAVENDRIAVTPLQLDLTENRVLKTLRQQLA